MLKKFFIETSTGRKDLQIEIADSFIGRLIGLIGRKNLPQGHGLLISPCNSVHMMFMRFPIDVVYLDENFCVKKIVHNLQTWTGISFCFGAKAVIEFAAGESERLNLKVGDKIFQSIFSSE